MKSRESLLRSFLSSERGKLFDPNRLLAIASKNGLITQNQRELIERLPTRSQRQEIFFLGTLLHRSKHDIELFTELAKRTGFTDVATYFEEEVVCNWPVHNEIDSSGKTSHTKLWGVPSRTQNFTDRADILNSLSTCFNQVEPSDEAVAVLFGLGGVGKTQAALQFLWTNKDRYKLIVWLRAETKRHLEGDYLAFARKCGIKARSAQIVFDELKQWLEGNQDWLLVFDRVIDYDMVRLFMPHNLSNGGNVLLTSQISTFPEWIKQRCQIQISPFTIAQSIEYTRSRLGTEKGNQDAAVALAEELGHLPLALSQAVAFVQETCIDIPSYLTLYTEDKKKVLQQMKSNFHIPLHSTFNLAVEKVKAESKLAINILNVAALLQSDKIPGFLFQNLSGKISECSRDNLKSNMLSDALSSLSKYSLVEVTGLKHGHVVVSLHNLVQSVTRMNWSQDDERFWIDHAIDAVESCFPLHKKTRKAYKTKRDLLPHAFNLLEYERASAPRLQKLNENHENSSLDRHYRLVKLVGEGSWDLGLLHDTIELWKQTLCTGIEIHGSSSVEITFPLSQLAIAYGALGDEKKKLEMLQQVLSIQESHYGPNHLKIVSTLQELGSAYGAIGDDKKKREMLERALAIQEPHYGSNHPEVAKMLHNLAVAYGGLGDEKKKCDILEKALTVQEAHYGCNHPVVARTLQELGNAYGALGDDRKKRDTLERALAIVEPHYGPIHPEVAITLHSLGNAYGALGDDKKKRDMLERALAIQEPHYGSNHLSVASTLHSLGNAYGALGDNKKKRDLLERALAIQEPHYGPNHPEVAILLHNLAVAYGALGDEKKKCDMLGKALAIQELHYGTNHPSVAITLHNLAITYGALGDDKKKLDTLKRALAMKERHYGPNHPSVAITLHGLANAYGALGDDKKKRDMLERALVIEEPYYGPYHPRVTRVLNDLCNAFEEPIKSKKTCAMM